MNKGNVHTNSLTESFLKSEWLRRQNRHVLNRRYEERLQRQLRMKFSFLNNMNRKPASTKQGGSNKKLIKKHHDYLRGLEKRKQEYFNFVLF